MRTLFLFASLLILLPAFAQDKPAYKIYTKEGKSVDFTKMMKEVTKAEVVLFGELHDNSIDHWLELQVMKALYTDHSNLAIGMEMFEADDQLVLNEYLNGTIEEKHLLSEAKVWDNYKNDYKPLIEFAKEKKLKAIATNIPRRYANLVFRKGVDALNELPADAKKWIAPLPVEIDLSLPGYKDMMAMAMHGSNMNAENMAKSQAMKDATMAYFILQNRQHVFLHFNGSYHSQNYEGINWYLKKTDPKIKIASIHTVEQSDIEKLEEENKNTADFIICIPKDMNKTY
ncbi:MAG: ChaN family lipoprotein [Cyclobacteriaceae bacterium]|nr:ChaN family lipoprotein [Cyclobacteriaceae bacterium]